MEPDQEKIENYLLEEEGGRDDRIGYLYLEFKREEVSTYKTIGMGLHARKGNLWIPGILLLKIIEELVSIFS